jgi:hypothetical protein
LDGFGEIFGLEEICEAAKEVSGVDGGAVEKDETFGEDPHSGDAGGQNQPHERPAFLKEFHHGAEGSN